MGSCQGLGVGLGDCPPQVCGGSPLYQMCCLLFFSSLAQVFPCSGGGGGGQGFWWAGLSAHPLGQCL